MVKEIPRSRPYRCPRHMFKSANDVLLYTANGVTQVRELAGEQRHLRWREAIRSGGLGPQLYVASP